MVGVENKCLCPWDLSRLKALVDLQQCSRMWDVVVVADDDFLIVVVFGGGSDDDEALFL